MCLSIFRVGHWLYTTGYSVCMKILGMNIATQHDRGTPMLRECEGEPNKALKQDDTSRQNFRPKNDLEGNTPNSRTHFGSETNLQGVS